MADLDETSTELIAEEQRLRLRLRHYENSRLVGAAVRMSSGLRVLLPLRSRRRRAVMWTVDRLRRSPDPEQAALARYRAWVAARTPTDAELEAQRGRAAAWAQRPVVGITMVLDGVRPEQVAGSLSSLERQSYDRWELHLALGEGVSPAVQRIVEEGAVGDGRLQVGPAAGRDTVPTGGELVGAMAAGSVLAPDALYRLVGELQDEPGLELLYCDEDVLDAAGGRRSPFLKPQWSPEALLGANWVGPFFLARRALVETALAMAGREGADPAHDLLLRLSELVTAVRHVPEVLYSSPPAAEALLPAVPAGSGRVAVEDALARRGLAGRVEEGSFPGSYRVRYAPGDPPPSVEILIPTRDRVDLLGPCLESIRRLTSYPGYRLTVVDNDSREPETRELFERSGVAVVAAPGPFNYAAIMNRAIAASEAELVVTLNNDTRVVDPDWLTGLVELGSRPDVGAVGCRLDFADGTVQHEGVLIGCGPPATNLAVGAPGLRVLGPIPVAREVSAVTGACCLLRRAAWDAVGRYDEDLGVVYNDVDLCLRLGDAGYRVLYTPFVTLVHEESSSRGALHPGEDEERFLRRWARRVAEGDPYFPPWLTIGHRGLALASEEDSALRRRLLERDAAGRYPEG